MAAWSGCLSLCLSAERAIAVWFFDAMMKAAFLLPLSTSLAFFPLVLIWRLLRPRYETASSLLIHRSFVLPISCTILIGGGEKSVCVFRLGQIQILHPPPHIRKDSSIGMPAICSDFVHGFGVSSHLQTKGSNIVMHFEVSPFAV